MIKDLEEKKQRIADRLLELGYEIEMQEKDFTRLAQSLKELSDTLLELDDLIHSLKGG